jgi:hypothetical protein
LCTISGLGTVSGLGRAHWADWLRCSVSDCFEVESGWVEAQVLEEHLRMGAKLRLSTLDSAHDVLKVARGLLQSGANLLNLLAVLGHSLLLFLGWNVARLEELEGELGVALRRAEGGLALGAREHGNLAQLLKPLLELGGGKLRRSGDPRLRRRLRRLDGWRRNRLRRWP